MNSRQKKILKAVALVLFLVVMTGCTRNLDEDGVLIAERAITKATPWSLSGGIFDFIIVIPIAKCIIYLSDVMNVALAVIITAILVNMITLPFMIKSTISTQRMQLIQPKVQAIQKKYQGRNDKNSQMRMSAELNALYKKNGVSMGSSFVPFLTLPLMLGMYYAVQRVEILYDAHFLGIALGEIPKAHILNLEIPYIVLLVLLAVGQWLSIEISQIMLKRKKGYRPNSQSGQMKMFNYVMIIMIVFIGLELPSAMAIYWITSSVIAILRTVLIEVKFNNDHKPQESYLTKK